MLRSVFGRESNGLKRGLTASIVVASMLLPGVLMSGSSATPSKSDLASAKARLAQLQRDFEVVVERYDATQSRLEAVRRKMSTTKVQVAELRKSVALHSKKAESYARRMYEGGPSATLEMVLSSRSLGAIESTLQYLKTTEGNQVRIFERVVVERKQLTLRLAQLDKARRQIETDVARLASLKSSINQKMSSQKDEVARLEAQIQRAQERARARRLAAQRRAAAAAAAAAAEKRQQPAPQAPSQPSAPAPTTQHVASTHTAAAPAPAPAPVSSAGGASTAVSTALAQVGKPYVWGASGPDSFDCSGLTMYAWAAAGVSLPHSSAMQYSVTQHISFSQAQPGDLLFYYSPISHVAMYIGGGRMVDAPHTGAVVEVTSARTSSLVGVGRP